MRFFLRLGSYTITACDTSDSTSEGLIVQYSNNAGITWSLLKTIPYYDYRSAPGQVTIVIPAAAKTSATRFKIWQPKNSGKGQDEWAIDDFNVATSDGIASYFRDTFDTSISSNWIVWPGGAHASYCSSKTKTLAFTKGDTKAQMYAQTKPLSLKTGAVVQFKVGQHEHDD